MNNFIEINTLSLHSAGGAYMRKVGTIHFKLCEGPGTVHYDREARQLLEFLACHVPSGTADRLLGLMSKDTRFNDYYLGEYHD